MIHSLCIFGALSSKAAKHDFCFAGLLTYSRFARAFPPYLYIGSGCVEWQTNVTIGAYSSGTVQDSHLIPFSSINLASVWRLPEQNIGKGKGFRGYVQAFGRKIFLMAAYICGTKRPTSARHQEFIDEFHALGRELLQIA